MSSKTVRDAFRALVTGPVWPVPYVETVNVAPQRDTLADVWMSLEFESLSDERVCVSTPTRWRERGVVLVTVAGLAGVGDDAVVQAAESVRAALHAWLPPEDMRLPSIAAPDDAGAAGANGQWHEIHIEVEYVLDVNR